METWQAVLLAIAALLAGALLPALVQAWTSLRQVTRAAEQVAADARRTLAAVTATAERLDRLTARLEEGRHVDRALDGVDALSRTAARLDDATRVASALGAAVGPAITAALRAWSATRPVEDDPPERSGVGAPGQDGKGSEP